MRVDDQGATVLYVLLESCILRIRVSIENCHFNINRNCCIRSLYAGHLIVFKRNTSIFLIIIKHRCIYKQMIDIKWVFFWSPTEAAITNI